MADLTVHCIVRNEEKWIWFALSSVLDFSKVIYVYDTGSTDKTKEIVKTINSKKINFEEKGQQDPKGLVKLRQEQLRKTKTEWFLILDGDEIWPKETKKELEEILKSAPKNRWAAVARAWNLVGDVYHYHPESKKYHWPFAPKDYLGWANLRLIRTSIPGLHVKGEYPDEAYCDYKNIPIQNYGENHLIFLNARYFHATYLQRSDSRQKDRGVLNRAKKGKLELGIKFSKDTVYPDVFFKNRPPQVASPWIKRSPLETSISVLQSPIKEVRRKLLNLYTPKPS